MKWWNPTEQLINLTNTTAVNHYHSTWSVCDGQVQSAEFVCQQSPTVASQNVCNVSTTWSNCTCTCSFGQLHVDSRRQLCADTHTYMMSLGFPAAGYCLLRNTQLQFGCHRKSFQDTINFQLFPVWSQNGSEMRFSGHVSWTENFLFIYFWWLGSL